MAIVGVAAVEFVSTIMRGTSWGVDQQIFATTAADLQDPVSVFVGTTAAIAATLLGLYYTTVGVVASTIYRSVPGVVRDLFIRERSSETYLRVLIFTTTAAVTVLVSRTLGYEVTGLTLAVLGVFTALTAVGLVVVTKHLFDYFDPSRLSTPLLQQIVVSIRVATEPKTRSLAQRQTDSHLDAYRALASFKHVVEMLSTQSLRSASAPVDLTTQLIWIVSNYSAVKYRIPTDSNWWDRVPRHQNWLTVDHTRLEMALLTSAGTPPELQPDYLWLETKAARLLRTTLAIAFSSQAGANALSVSGSVARLVGNLTARLQIDEAVTIETAWDDAVSGVTMTSHVAAGDADDYEVRLNQMAAAESLLQPLAFMLLGLSNAAERIAATDLSADLEAAIANPDVLYRGDLPTETRQMVEKFSLAIERELRLEGRRITPTWWIAHLAARSMSEALLATEAGVLERVKDRTVEQVDLFRAQNRPDLAAVTGMASLELFDKIEFHEKIIRRAEAHLKSYCNSNTSIEGWPERTQSPFDAADEHTAMVERLAELLPDLWNEKFDPREPDLYGQLYQFVVNGAFTAIIGGDTARGLKMYTACVLEMDQARVRIAADLNKAGARTQTTFAVEPIITVMDLAGYALVMYELDSDGIWPQIKEMWNRIFDSKPDLAQFLLDAAMFVDATFAMTPGGLERSRRQIGLNRVLDERGVRANRRSGFGGADGAKRPHRSPIISALAPGDYGIHDDLYSLFIAEVLAGRLPPETDIGHRAKSLAGQIARHRADDAQRDGSS
ncbi:hypothetical protein [Demequina subtropica]|uniref:hypothetical protein n=1 Tax=Demequina subtropica TaxID=1638989 RepID=UPI0007841FFA|nr:hypothetical protein [Demequina subtropica]